MRMLPYQQALARIRADFHEMPGMQLTAGQVARLSGVDSTICQSALEDLGRAGFLRISANGTYGRPSAVAVARERDEEDRPRAERELDPRR